jgi:hypothetical protein
MCGGVTRPFEMKLEGDYSGKNGKPEPFLSQEALSLV